MGKLYKVCVVDVPTYYKTDYFPRKFALLKDAKAAALKAIDMGATMVRIEYPDGRELDFRPDKPAPKKAVKKQSATEESGRAYRGDNLQYFGDGEPDPLQPTREEVEELAYPETTADRLRREEGEQRPDPTISEFHPLSIGRKMDLKPARPSVPSPAPTAAMSSPTASAPTVETTPTTAPATTWKKGTSLLAAAVNGAIAARAESDTLPRISGPVVTHYNAPHVIVRARAGTGKTTTIIEGVANLRGIPTLIEPSDEQAAVWAALEPSKTARYITLLAFGNKIAAALDSKLKQRGLDKVGVKAKTLHSLGYGCVWKAYPNLGSPNEHRVKQIVAGLLNVDLRQLRRERKEMMDAVRQLVGLCKQNLIDQDTGTREETLDGTWDTALTQLVHHHDIELNGVDSREVYQLVPEVLEKCKDVEHDLSLDFDDMVWLPLVLNLRVFRSDLLLVDEAQDLNRMQQELAKRAGDRIVYVGDDRQAIFGFAGADATSLPNIEKDRAATPRKCIVLPLTETRRCGKAIVEEARKEVPDFRAHPSNGPGKISEARYPFQRSGKYPDYTITELPWDQTYAKDVRDGDFILCRCNAPLVNQCFRFIKRGKKATIQGRKIGDQLKALVERMDALEVTELISKITDWAEKERAKELAMRNPSDAKLLSIEDRAECVLCFTADAPNVAGVIKRIDAMFTDNPEPGITLSSIHSAKGLEADRVWFLQPYNAPCPHPMAKSDWAQGQEKNLWYVAVTRAKDELIHVY